MHIDRIFLAMFHSPMITHLYFSHLAHESYPAEFRTGGDIQPNVEQAIKGTIR